MRSEGELQRQMSEGNACSNTPGQELDAPCRQHSTAFTAGLCREQGAGRREQREGSRVILAQTHGKAIRAVINARWI